MQKTTNSFGGILFFIVNISMRKMTLEVEYFKSMIYQILKNFQKTNLFHPEMIPGHLFALEIQKNTGLLIFNSLKQ